VRHARPFGVQLKNQTRITVLALAVFMLVASSNIAAQARYKVGDRVECDFNATGNYGKGTISPFLEGDAYNGMSADSGKW